MRIAKTSSAVHPRESLFVAMRLFELTCATTIPASLPRDRRNTGKKMKHTAILVVTSLLSILLLTLHITDDIVRGISKAEPSNTALLVLVVFLFGTLALAERRRNQPSGAFFERQQQ